MTETAAHGHPALTDALTGLPNRLHFDTVYRVVFKAVNRGIPVAVAAMEVDDFPDVASRDGKEAGEALVKVAADRVGRTVRGADLFARVGESRFFLLLFDCNPQGARIAADRFQETAAMDEPEVSLSIGAASTNRDEMSDPAELIRAAEDALERARAAGDGEVEVFHAAR